MQKHNFPMITELTDSELDAVAAGTQFNFVGAIGAVQTNFSVQSSLNVITLASGNQVAVQSNNVSVGGS